MMSDIQKARALGWFSLGIGLTKMAAPKFVQRQLGLLGNYRRAIRAMGMRELLHAVTIFSERKPTVGVWSRVAGDAIDLAFLGATSKRSVRPRRMAAATAMVLGITALDLMCAMQLRRKEGELLPRDGSKMAEQLQPQTS